MALLPADELRLLGLPLVEPPATRTLLRRAGLAGLRRGSAVGGSAVAAAGAADLGVEEIKARMEEKAKGVG